MYAHRPERPADEGTAPRLRRGPILIAAGSGEGSGAAMHLARTLQSRTGAAIRLTSGAEPTESLVAAARDSDASFVVSDHAHHGLLERLAHTETSLAVLRGSSTPILAVHSLVMPAMERVLIAIDGSASCLDAIDHAAPLLADARLVHLVHVQDSAVPLSEASVYGSSDDAWITGAFAKAKQRLDAAGIDASRTEVHTCILSGSPAVELAKHADRMRAELFVMGHQHRGLWGRVVHSSVAERVYRLTTCAVLIVPELPRPATHRQAPLPGIRTEVFTRPTDWPRELRCFTERHEGRRVDLEVVMPELIAQAAAVNMPLLAVEFDQDAMQVDIALGGDPGTRHLTHTIRDVVTIDLSRKETGADHIIRFTHSEGQTLLTLRAPAAG